MFLDAWVATSVMYMYNAQQHVIVGLTDSGSGPAAPVAGVCSTDITGYVKQDMKGRVVPHCNMLQWAVEAAADLFLHCTPCSLAKIMGRQDEPGHLLTPASPLPPIAYKPTQQPLLTCSLWLYKATRRRSTCVVKCGAGVLMRAGVRSCLVSDPQACVCVIVSSPSIAQSLNRMARTALGFF